MLIGLRFEMHSGIQLIAPEGFCCLSKNTIYYFLKNDAKSERVFLAILGGGNDTKPTANLIVINRNQFEKGLEKGSIVVAEVQCTLPPWLSALEGLDMAQIDSFRPNAKKLHSERVEERLLFIASALTKLEEIFSSSQPELEINRLARACVPQQNESRFRLWLLSYLCFGGCKWVLLPPFHRVGNWNRQDHPDIKFGRHSLAHGKLNGYPSNTEMINKIEQGYEKFAEIGVTMNTVYQNSMIKIFKCTTLKIPSVVNPQKMVMSYKHPEGKPFPTYGQFKYRVIQKFSLEVVQKTLYGVVRHRTRLAASKGSYSESVANLMERVEADGYYTVERPKSYVEGASLNPLCVVRGRDFLSGLLVGIGFSLNKERGDAYRMMLFSMAVPKDFFCRLFGISITNEEWPSQGMPILFGVDRGPGAKKNLIENLEHRFPIKDMAPSWSGQSKATIESSHPRQFEIEGQPTYFHSELTPVELARREVIDTVKYNHHADMSGRIQPNSDMVLMQPTPIELWNFYDSRFRTDAQPMSLEDAVRAFLTKIELVIRNDGVWLGDQKYDSSELRASGVLDQVARSSSVKVVGFCVDLTVRYLWVEVEGKLLMLEAQMLIRGDSDDLFYSLVDLEQWNVQRGKVKSENRENKYAVASHYRERFEESTGKGWDEGIRKSGKPSKKSTQKNKTYDKQHQNNPDRKAA